MSLLKCVFEIRKIFVVLDYVQTNIPLLTKMIVRRSAAKCKLVLERYGYRKHMQGDRTE